MSEPARAPLPAVNFLRFDDKGAAYLQGTRCADCGAVAPGARLACNACGARSGMESIRLGERGTIYTYTIVHRSFPGVKTPFVSIIVDLDGGGALKGSLLGVNEDPRDIRYGMPVNVVYRDTGQKSPDGSPFYSYYFEPSQSAP
jgi:uncharacterized OB-fold protein